MRDAYASLTRLRARTGALIFAALVLAVAALALCGWAFNIPVLYRVSPSLPPMLPITALAFVCAGGALALLALAQHPDTHVGRLQRGAAAALSIVVALLGLLTLVRNFPLPGTVFVSGLPSPTTALNTIFVGLALLLMATQLRTAVGFAQWLAIMSFLLAIQALIGSMLDADVLNTVIGAANMGPITILLFVLVSAGALLVEPAGTFIMAWRRTTAGALFRRLTIGVAALLVIGPVVWLLILRTTLFGPGIVLVLFVATTLSLLGWLAEWLDRAERGRALAEQAQRANAARLATLASASQTFAAAENDYQGLLNHITRTIAAELGDGCSILQISADGQRLEPSTRYDRDPALQSLLPTLGGGVALDADSANPSVQVFRSGRALLVPVIDIAQIQATLPPSYNAIFERIRPRSLIVVPLRVRGSTVGVLNVYRYTPEAPSFDEGDMLLAQELAARAALAIENAQLFSNEQQQRQLAELIAARLERLHAVSAALSGARSVAEVASVIMTQGVDALGADAGLVALLGDSSADLQIVDARGYDPNVLGNLQRIPLAQPSVLTEAVRLREPLWLSTLANQQRDYPHLLVLPLSAAFQARAALPLQVETRVIGVLQLNFLQERPFDAAERRLLEALALIGAQALERAQIYDQQQRSLLRLQVLRTIDQGILNSRPLETIVGSALDDLHMLVPYHHGRVARALFDEHPAQIIAAREWRLMERGTEARASASIDDMATVCFEQKPVTTPDLAAATPRTRDIELLLAQGIRSRLAQPLIADGLYLGQLEVLSAQPAAFLEDHVQIVSEIAAQFAVVMRQVQLLGERERAEERFRLVVEASPSGLVMVDLAGQIALVNRAAEQMFGYSRAELLGQPVEMLVPPRFRSGHPALRHGFAGRPEARAMGAGRDLLGLRKDGSEFPVEIGLNPIEASDGLHFLTVIADITERRRAAEALLASERRFHQMIDSMLEGVQIIGFDWRYRYLNDGAVAHGRKPREELIGRTMMEVYPGIEHTAVFQMLQRCMEGREPARLENRYEYADGSSAWFELSVQPALEGIFVLSADVTERKQIEEAIRETELKLRSLVEILPVGVSILDDKSKVVYSNLALEHIIELPIELVIQGAHQARTYIRPDGSPMLRDEFASTRALREQRAVYNVETGIVKENGAVTWVSVNAAPVDFPNWRVAVVTSDITERKHAEAALQESEERFATAFQSSPAALAISRQRNSSFIDVNEAFCALLGYAREEVLGHTWQELDLFPDTAILAGIARDAREHGSVHQAEISIRTKDGGIRSVLFSTETVEANGEPCFLTLFFDVTERKIAQEALRKSEERFARAFHASPAAMLITRQSDGVFLDVNASYEELAEYRRDELIGKTGIGLDLYVTPGQRAEIIGLLHESGALSNHELLLRTKSGALRTVLCGLESIELDGVPCYLGSLVDITERKHAEAALRESEERFAKAFRASPAAISISRVRDSHFIDVNDRFCTLFGYRRDEVIERTMIELELFPDLVALAEVRHAAQSRGTIRDAEIAMQTKDRAQLTMLFSVEQIEVNGEPCFLTLLFDVTERKQAEDALREREAQLHLLTETMPAVPWSATPAGNIDYFTQRWLDLTGLTHDQALNDGWQNIVHPDDLPAMAAAWQHSLATGAPYDVVHRIRTADGSYRWQRSRALPQRSAIGNIVRWHGITDDIHDLRMAEVRVRESEQRFRQLAESLPQLVWTCLPSGPCDYISRQWSEYTGLPEADHLGFGWFEALHPDDRALTIAAWLAAVENRSDFITEFRIRRYDGTYRWFDASAVLLRDAADQPLKWVGANTDVEERRRSQETLQHNAEQLQRLSHQLVEAQETERRNIARELHDQVGQSLTGLKLVLDSTRMLAPEALGAQLAEARRAINELLGQVRNLSLDLRPSMLDDLGLLPALRWLIDRYQAQTSITVHWWYVNIDRRFPALIETTVYRIVQEALTNVARYAKVSDVELRIMGDYDQLLVQVDDEGVGFDIEARLQSRQSVGLIGMRERVDLLGGSFLIESAPNEGTHLNITIPLPIVPVLAETDVVN